MYDYASQVTSYDDAVTALKALYIKPTNEVFARHQLAIRQQKESEYSDEFLQASIIELDHAGKYTHVDEN